MSVAPHLLILGAHFRKGFVGVRPAFGYEGDPMRLLFEHGFADTRQVGEAMILAGRGDYILDVENIRDHRLLAQLAADPAVQSAVFVGREEALQRFRTLFRDLRTLPDDLGALSDAAPQVIERLSRR